jgi:probable HAF family extracellular repeat protein
MSQYVHVAPFSRAIFGTLFLWLGGLFTFVPTCAQAAPYTLVDLGASNDYAGSSATAMNDNGVVVGNDSVGNDSQGYSPAPAVFTPGAVPQIIGENRGYGSIAAINSSNEIVGEFTLYSNQHKSAGIFSANHVAILNPFTGSSSQATGINNAGFIVGFYAIGLTGDYGSFIYHHGRFSNLGHLPGDSSVMAYAINQKGWVTGGSADPGPQGKGFRTFLYRKGKMSVVAEKPRYEVFGYAINNQGDIAGTSIVAYLLQSSRAFLYSGGALTLFGPLKGDKHCSALSINSFGQVVGGSGPTPMFNGPALHGFLYTDGHVIDLNTLVDAPGWKIEGAVAINDRGQIAATAKNPDGHPRAVRLDPAVTLQFVGPATRTVISRAAMIRGSANALTGISRVEYRLGKRGHYRIANGTDQWQTKLRLKHGLNRISLRAITPTGEKSLPMGITIRVR